MLDFDDELDYEEGDLQNDVEPKKNGAEDESMARCGDQYLQIHVSEEEENFIFGGDKPLITGKTEKEIQTEGMKVDKSNEAKKLPGKKLFTQTCTFKKSKDNKNELITNSKYMKNKDLNPVKKYSSEFKKRKGRAPGPFQKKPNFFNKNYQCNDFPKAEGPKEQTIHEQIINNNRTDLKFNEFEENGCKGINFKNDEKEIVKLRKEARLKRFMNEDIIISKERKLIDSGSGKGSEKNFILEVQDIQKVKEQEITIEDSLKTSLPQYQNEKSDINKLYDFRLREKPYINKALLLKMRNPFDENFARTTVDEENEKEKSEDECKVLRWVEVTQHSTRWKAANPLRTSIEPGKRLYVVKNDSDSSVKFVRTVPKTFGDLPVKNQSRLNRLNDLSKSNGSAVSHISNSWSSESGVVWSRDKAFAQRGSLLGCIVKVLNVPPSTSAKDILGLCKPVGTVVEIKLNYPKENSVVIRFAEPISAEKFFNFYHGQRLNNYLLNVIVV